MQARYLRALSILAQLAAARPTRTDVPARLDRLPWCRWHWLMLSAFAILWALTGLEVSVVAISGPTLIQSQTVNLSISQLGIASASYLFGAVLSAPVFGYLSDLFGRRKPFVVALGIFLVGSLLTALAWGFWSFTIFRFLAGVGVGGEYVAITSSVVELVPPRFRGRAVAWTNASFWMGASVAASASVGLLNPDILSMNLGWRVLAAVGTPLLFGIFLFNRYVPESPRRLLVQGMIPQAGTTIAWIEAQVRAYTGFRTLPKPDSPIFVRPVWPFPIPVVANTLFRVYPWRSLLAFCLVAPQAFLFNAIFFTYALLLSSFYGISTNGVGLYLLGLAGGSLIGPWALGGLFDSLGRKPLIVSTYLASAFFVGVTGYLFTLGVLDPIAHTIAWSVILLLASIGANGAYLSTGELFPQEMRATAFGFLFATGTLAGIAGPMLFALLLQTGSQAQLFYGYLVAAALLAIAALAEIFLGIATERRTLESIARPLSLQSIGAAAPHPKKPRRKAA